MNAALRDELVAMAAEDQRVRAQLAAGGSLFDGYHPRMEEVHRRNAARLTEVIEQHGRPGRGVVGEDGARAAWLVLQHAIAHPDLQRQGLVLLREAVARGDVPAVEAAMLEDRVRVFEGRPQRYGTQFDWDENGQLNPLPIEDEANVDVRRSVGLGPLAEEVRRRRAARPAAWRSRPAIGPSGSGSSRSGRSCWGGGSEGLSGRFVWSGSHRVPGVLHLPGGLLGLLLRA